LPPHFSIGSPLTAKNSSIRLRESTPAGAKGAPNWLEHETKKTIRHAVFLKHNPSVCVVQCQAQSRRIQKKSSVKMIRRLDKSGRGSSRTHEHAGDRLAAVLVNHFLKTDTY
jgi:hypothetical protein